MVFVRMDDTVYMVCDVQTTFSRQFRALFIISTKNGL